MKNKPYVHIQISVVDADNAIAGGTVVLQADCSTSSGSDLVVAQNEAERIRLHIIEENGYSQRRPLPRRGVEEEKS